MLPIGSVIAVFQPPLWWWLLPLLVSGCGLVVFAVLAWQRNGRGAAAVLCAVCFGGWISWMIVNDAVILTDQGVFQRTGYLRQSYKGFVFAQVKNVVIETRPHKRHATLVHEWILDEGTAAERAIDPGDLWDTHEQRIVDEAVKTGVAVTRRRAPKR